MPSKRQQNSGAPLPDPITGYNTICFQMDFPDNLEYKAAMNYVTSMLGKWWFWEKMGKGSGDTRARDAAEYMREFLLTAQFTDECGVTTMLRVEDCILQYFDQVTETWVNVPGWDADCFVGPPGPQGEQGIPGEDGVCEDCGDTPAPEDDNGTPPPPGTPGDEQRCKVAQGVVDSLLDNYYIPVLDYWIDVFVTQGLQAVDAIEALRLMLIGQSAGALAWPPSAVGLIGSIGSALFGVMVALTSAAEAQNNLDIKNALNDEETREQLYCMLYNVLGEDGNISATVWGDFLSALQSEGGLPFIDLWNYLKDFIPLYVARTEAYITQGGDFDCDVCGDGACPAEVFDWNTIDATPADWFSADIIDFTGWVGDVSTFNTGTRNYTCTRAPFGWWTNNHTAVAGSAGKIGIKRVLAEPCIVNRLRFTYRTGNGNTKIMMLAAKDTTGTYRVIHRQQFNAVSPLNVSVDHTLSTPLEVEELYFLAVHGGTGGAPFSISAVGINEP